MEWEGLRFQKLVRWAVNRMWGSGWYAYPGGKEDLEQDVWFTVMEAIDRYDPSYGVPLEQFVAVCVRRRLVRLRDLWFRNVHSRMFSLDEEASDGEGEEYARQKPYEGPGPDERVAILELIERLPPNLGGQIARMRLNGLTLDEAGGRITGRKYCREHLRRLCQKAIREAGYG